MRLVTFSTGTRGEHHLGLVRDTNHLVDLTGVRDKPPFDPTDMVSLIAAGDVLETEIIGLGLLRNRVGE
jgi:hypothetical protein